jgi:PAS domain S-box-containing protein
MSEKPKPDLLAENQELRARLEEAQETLDAIRRGEVDGLVISTSKGEQVYTITSAEKPYRALIEEMREGAIMLSDDNMVLYCNSGFAGMVKQPMEKIVGVNIETLICPTYRESLKELLSKARARRGAVAKEITLQTATDTVVPTLMSANSLESDTLKNTFLVVTDLTQHMKDEVKQYTAQLELTQIALSESEHRWATTLASIGDAVIATDMNGKVKFMNGVSEGLTGWTLLEASGKPVESIFKIVNELTHETVDDPVFKVLEKGVIVGLANHTILVRKDGTELAVDDSGAPIRDKSGKITGVVLIFRDITQRRQMEAKLDKYRKHLEDLVEERSKQLKDAERMAAIGQTAGMVGHDIRNPLQSILSELYLTKSELAPLPEGPTKSNMIESIGHIEDDVIYINKIVQDLQDFARPLKLSLQEIDLQAICEDLLERNLSPNNVKISCIIEPDAKKILADPDTLRRVLANLVTNSIQAMPNGGEITIRGSNVVGSTVITVRDTGVGIPEEIKSKIFTPLITTKAKGQGFGLAVVKRFAEAMGGEVTFESQLAKGTTFTLKLPIQTKSKKD